MKLTLSKRCHVWAFLLYGLMTVVWLCFSYPQLSYMTDKSVTIKGWDENKTRRQIQGTQSVNGTFIENTFFSEKWEKKRDKSDWLARNNNSSPDIAESAIIGLTKALVETKQDIYGNDWNNNSDATRKDDCMACLRHDFRYVIDNDSICKVYSASQTIDLIIVIFTVHGHEENRNILRQTWLTPTRHNTANVRYVFLVGETSNQKLRQAIADESKQYGDIIKEDFIDSYGNLTYKTIMGMKWAATKCSDAKYYMKTDNDVYVNIENLLNYLATNGKILSISVAGACHEKAIPIRNTKSKWFASNQSYPHGRYPGTCFGTGYITSLGVARKIYKISPDVPFFHLEDVYVALCIRQLGLNIVRVQGFHANRPKLDPCVFKGDNFYTGHYMTGSRIIAMWNGECKRR